MKKRMISFLLALMLMVSLIPTAAITASAASKWTTSINAVKVLTEMQGFQAEPYEKNGDFYIGYGSLVRDASGKKPANLAAAKALYPNGINKEDALKLVQDHLADTVDKTINNFTKAYNLDLTQNQHDALALYSYRTGNMAWQTDPVYQAARTGKTGNDFINTIANVNVTSEMLKDSEGLAAEMNLRLSEANMYLNNQYAYNRGSNMAYTVMVSGTVGTSFQKLVAYSTASGYVLQEPTDWLYKNGQKLSFLGWAELTYAYDAKNNSLRTVIGTPVSILTKDYDAKTIIAKIAPAGKSIDVEYTFKASNLPSRYVFTEPCLLQRDLDKYLQKDWETLLSKIKDELKSSSDFEVTKEQMMSDGGKWLYGKGTNTQGKEVMGWIFLGKLPTGVTTDGQPIATATVTANAGVNVLPGATSSGSPTPLDTLAKGTTVNIYEVKVEYTEHGNKTWGKVSYMKGTTRIEGWIDLSKTDVTEISGSTDSAQGKTGKIVNAEWVNVRENADVNSNKLTMLSKGTKVTVLETKMNGAAQWGKVRWEKIQSGYTEGWVYMYYVELDDAPHTNPGGDGTVAGTVLYTGEVTSNIDLNVRNKPDVYGKKVGSLPKGTKINVYELATSNSMKWGRIGVDQWVCLAYVKLTAVSNSGSSGSGNTGTTEIQATVTSNTLAVMKSYNNNSQQIGTLNKGDVVTILERNTENTGTGTRIWGRFIKGNLEGWINLAYADVKTVTNITNPDNSGNSGNTSNGNANGADAFIANCMAVNVREAAGTSSKQLLKLNSGIPVKVYEKVTKDNAPWARITWNNGASEGWVCMYYVEMKTATNGGNGSNIGNTNSNTISAVGTVNSNIALNVRAGAGLGFAKIGTLGNGAKVTVYEQVSADGMIWGRIPYGNGSGYVCMSYINVDAASFTGKGVMGTIARCFKAVNVRSAPGTNNALVATIDVGSRVEVFEQKLYSNQYWGRVAQGWICMDYVLLDSELPPGVILDQTQPTTQATTQATVPTETINKDNEVLYTINGTAMDDLNVFNSASDTSLKVGKINQGSDLKILAVKSNNAELWGRIDQHATAGWVKMNTKTATMVYYHVDGYVNTDDQPVYADPNTSSTIKGTLSVNHPLKIEKMTVNGETVYGWVEEGLQGWIPMGRISDEMQKVIPVCDTETQDAYLAARTIGRTNAAIEAVDDIIGGKVVFKLKANVKVYIGDIHTEAGYVWGRVAFQGKEGYIKLNAVNFEIGASAKKDLKVRKIKDTSDGDNVLGTLTSVDSFKICELSFDAYGNLWGKVSGAKDSMNESMTVLNGGYIPVNSNTVTINSDQAPIVY